MLQWMGGSRRKVKTSRKSIQNRQHQYFQQRQRQQRAELLEQNADDPETMSQNIQESKSLDVASLMNILTAYAPGVSDKEKGLMQRKADSKNEQTRDHIHTTCAGLNTGHHFFQNASFKADAETQWTPSSATEAAKASGHTRPFSINLHENSQRAKHEELKEQNSKANHPPKRFSVLDIISDNSEGSCQNLSPLEAYAAFAVEGTGKLKDKTPDNFEPMKGSSVFKRVEKRESYLSAMPVDASLLTPESQFGWEDENHQRGIFPEKISISNAFMAPSVKDKEKIHSSNDSEFQENFYIFSCDGSSQKEGPLIDFSPSPNNSSIIYDNHLRASNFSSARHVMDAASNLLNGEGDS